MVINPKSKIINKDNTGIGKRGKYFCVTDEIIHKNVAVLKASYLCHSE